jgi:glycosyltransferase involved in cell wall biosynthesis
MLRSLSFINHSAITHPPASPGRHSSILPKNSYYSGLTSSFEKRNPHQPLVSVIMPAYNVRDYIGEAIQSVLGQTYPNLELIIVNDGSSDGTREIIDYFAKTDSRVQGIHQEPTGNNAIARNHGFLSSQGTLIAQLDADDVFQPNALSLAVQQFQQEPSLQAVYGLHSNINPEGEPYFDSLPLSHMQPTWPNLLTGKIPPQLQALTVKRQLWESVKGIPTVDVYGKDYLFYAKIFSHLTQQDTPINIKLIPENVFLYRVHPESLTHDPKRFDRHLKNIPAFLDYLFSTISVPEKYNTPALKSRMSLWAYLYQGIVQCRKTDTLAEKLQLIRHVATAASKDANLARHYIPMHLASFSATLLHKKWNTLQVLSQKTA